MKEIYLTLADAATRLGKDPSYLLHLSATNQLPLYVRVFARSIQPLHLFQPYGIPYSIDGLLSVSHINLARLESGAGTVSVSSFKKCVHITPPGDGAKVIGDPPDADPKSLTYQLVGESIKLSIEKLLVLTEDLELMIGTQNIVELSRDRWPWGSHETELLKKLAQAGERFWSRYDPSDATTAPTNEMVVDWLVGEGVASRTAEAMATILRADGLRPGPRR